ncbi:uncharacterized protein LOC125237341 [Leguminivora glycinivorella]|uniref:uncharacterized protein LOC125237341 n=1 Tax=Leguminivora glycinivorella TaxID=1035111 RepID=UPI00200F2B3C|nr:uncharacterized protein LOC125237341 [Leguminivora glycinivorella]
MWLYTAVIRPIIAYGAVVWWPRTKLTTARNKLQRFQRLASIATTGCMRTTPSEALEVLLGLPPLDLFIQQEAASAAVRLKSLNLWGASNGAHTMILRNAIEYQPLMMAPNDRVPKVYIFNIKYNIQLVEEENDWSRIHELRIYTDGSKTKTGSGAGVYSPEINTHISTALGEYSSIYQCECFAIIQAANAVAKRRITNQEIRIVSDSAAVLRALDSKTIQSGLILECHRALEVIGSNNLVTLQWIKGHSGSLRNDAADELARKGSDQKATGPIPMLPLPFGQLRSWMRQKTRTQHAEQWANTSTCRHSREVVPHPDARLTKRLLTLNRASLRIIVGNITGHCPLNKHLHVIGKTDSPLCRGCLSAEETVAHVILECEGVNTQRAQILKTTRSLREACGDTRRILRFWAELGWLDP